MPISRQVISTLHCGTSRQLREASHSFLPVADVTVAFERLSLPQEAEGLSDLPLPQEAEGLSSVKESRTLSCRPSSPRMARRTACAAHELKCQDNNASPTLLLIGSPREATWCKTAPDGDGGGGRLGLRSLGGSAKRCTGIVYSSLGFCRGLPLKPVDAASKGTQSSQRKA